MLSVVLGEQCLILPRHYSKQPLGKAMVSDIAWQPSACPLEHADKLTLLGSPSSRTDSKWPALEHSKSWHFRDTQCEGKEEEEEEELRLHDTYR